MICLSPNRRNTLGIVLITLSAPTMMMFIRIATTQEYPRTATLTVIAIIAGALIAGCILLASSFKRMQRRRNRQVAFRMAATIVMVMAAIYIVAIILTL